MKNDSGYQLITPTQKLIEQFSRLWNGGATEEDKRVELFKGTFVNNIQEFLPRQYSKFCEEDKTIKRLLENGEIEEGLKKINDVYHTRLKPKTIEKLVKDNEKSWSNWDSFKAALEEIGVNNFVINSQRVLNQYAYSFASKVFCFINENEYPIIDSYVATLLDYYLESYYSAKNEKRQNKKSSWGVYTNYKNAYDAFRRGYPLEKSLTYKEIDIFLWTYGVAIQEYWRREGVLQFSSVSFKK